MADLKFIACKSTEGYKWATKEFQQMTEDLLYYLPQHGQNPPDVVKIDRFWFAVTTINEKRRRRLIYYTMPAESLGLEEEIACECVAEKK